jgi:DNA-binding HxlR family transcriptional regulator
VKSYGQYCGLARALDVIGDRWVLLIVRELLDGPRRYAELLDGLPGIATNLLVDRLRSMETSGLLARQDDGRYALTSRGEALNDVVYAMGRWAGPLMLRPPGDDAFRSHWFRHMVVVRFEGVDPRRGNLVLEIHSGDEPMTLISAGGRVHMVRGRVDKPDIVLAGPPEGVVGVIVGAFPPAEAAARGVSIVGDARKLKRLRPAYRSATATATATAPEATTTA